MNLRKPLHALTASLLLTLPLTSSSPADIPNDLPISQILTLASTAFSSGSPVDALAYYDIALQRGPPDFLTLFKRGATYLSLGRSSQALSDFDKALVLKPDFEGALIQRAKIRQRNADWAGARSDLAKFASTTKGAEDIKALDEAEGAATLAKNAEKSGDWDACIAQAGVAILVAGASAELRQRRGTM